MENKLAKEKSIFKFRVKQIAYGWCHVCMTINNHEIDYWASCVLGYSPIGAFIEACADFMSEESDKLYITWYAEPGTLKMNLELDENQLLHMDIMKYGNESDNDLEEEWHEVIPYECFVSAIISEGFRVLKTYGLYGYRASWQNGTDFPLSALLRITKKCDRVMKGDSWHSNIFQEIECIKEFL